MTLIPALITLRRVQPHNMAARGSTILNMSRRIGDDRAKILLCAGLMVKPTIPIPHLWSLAAVSGAN